MAAAALIGACAPMVPPDRVALRAAEFSDLPGWARDDPRDALVALARSCRALLRKPQNAAVGPRALAGRVADWAPPCRDIAGTPAIKATARSARDFLERRFRVYEVWGDGGRDGLFTGYFELTLKGARQRRPGYEVPLYRRPDDLVTADLGAFSRDWRGRSIAGRVRNGRLVPYADRTEIRKGALAGRGLERPTPHPAFRHQPQRWVLYRYIRLRSLACSIRRQRVCQPPPL